jgi:hypothetical protein
VEATIANASKAPVTATSTSAAPMKGALFDRRTSIRFGGEGLDAAAVGWDTDALRVEFTELKALNLDFPIEITGFNGAQIDALVLAGEGGSERGDVVPRLVLEPTSRLGEGAPRRLRKALANSGPNLIVQHRTVS